MWKFESDKVTLEIPAPASGVLRITAEAGAEMEVGDIVATIDTDATAPSGDQGSDVQAADPGDSGPASVVEAATAAAAEETPRPTSMAAKVAADAGVDVNSVTGTGAHGRVTKADVLAASMPVPTTPNRPNEPAASVAQPLAIDATGTRGVRREKMSRLRARIAEPLGGSPANRRHVDDLQRSRHERSDAAPRNCTKKHLPNGTAWDWAS